jgi:hypothetical protein
MAVARAKAGLSAVDLETLRTAVAAGRKPKVTFTASAGQIAGRTGQVTRLEDPDAAEEWVVVRFGKDELPFAPMDLKFPDPKPAAKAAQKVEAVKPPQWTPAPPPRAEAAKAAAPADPAESGSSAPSTNGAAPKAVAGVPAVASGGGASGAGAAPKPAARKAAGKRPPELTVTLSCQDGHWSVQAHRGAKVLVKAVPVRASEALKMVALLDAPPVHAVVEEIVDAARLEAEQQAERLRRELAEVEAALADLREIH